MSINIEALDLSQYDPEMTIITVRVYVGKMRPDKVKAFIDTYRNQIAPIFRKRGFEDVIFVPVTFDMAQSGFPTLQANTNVKSDDWKELPDLEIFKDKILSPPKTPEKLSEEVFMEAEDPKFEDQDIEYFCRKMARAVVGTHAEKPFKQLMTAKAANDVVYKPVSTLEAYIAESKQTDVYDPYSQVEDFVFPNDSDKRGSKVEDLSDVIKATLTPDGHVKADAFEDAREVL